jgi:hypothetical protein
MTSKGNTIYKNKGKHYKIIYIKLQLQQSLEYNYNEPKIDINVMEKLLFLHRTSRVDTSVAKPEMRFKKI